MEVELQRSGQPVLTAQQMLERNIVPVKAEYLFQKGQPAKQADGETLPSVANGNGTHAASKEGHGSEKEGRKDPDQSRGQTRKQMRKDVRSGRQSELCINFALGRCTYGNKCKFGHAVAEHLKSKPADLPGVCPWTAVQAVCPYGITCRYARSHQSDDDFHRLLASLPRAPSADAGAAGTVALNAPCVLPVPTSIEKETNAISKDVQAQLWKNRYDYTRADAILKSMGIRISFKSQPKPMTTGPSGDGGGGGTAREKGAAGMAAGEQPQTQKPAVEAASPVEMRDGGLQEGIQEGIQAIRESQPMQADGGGGSASADDAEELGTGDRPALKRQRLGDGGAAAPAPAAAEGAATAVTSGGSVPATLKAEQEASAATAASGLTEVAPPPKVSGSPAEVGAVGVKEGAVEEARALHVELPLRPCEKRVPDFRGRTYLAPLTTVGNLPFRRVCKALGADVTCGEMAMATNLLQGQASEWALMKRHPSEDFYGVQICGGFPDALARVGQLLGEQVQVDFVDINMGCPIDLVCDKSAGSALLRQPRRIEQILRATSAALGDTPLTFKTRKGYNDGEDVAHTFLNETGKWGAAAVTLHGRTRQQRYSKLADWEYIKRCGESCSAAGLQLIGNGDVFSYLDWNQHMQEAGGHLSTLMIGRGALMKPWIFTEIKEQRHWDISASERLDVYKQFCSAGLEHWGSDSRGVENTRRFLLEWLSFTCRYVPVGLLEVLPQRMNHRPPAFFGRSDLETLMASDKPQDWVRISEMLLGPPPAPINFTAKHKSNSYGAASATSELDMARG